VQLALPVGSNETRSETTKATPQGGLRVFAAYAVGRGGVEPPTFRFQVEAGGASERPTACKGAPTHDDVPLRAGSLLHPWLHARAGTVAVVASSSRSISGAR